MRLSDQIAVEPAGPPGEFVSKLLPSRMGNIFPIAYGGCTIAAALAAAGETVPTTHRLYSALGHFLGPASTEQRLRCCVQALRDTRSFATRRVTVTQPRPDGADRPCLELTADFHVPEPAWMDYSARPACAYPPPEACPASADLIDRMQARGVVSEERAALGRMQLEMMGQFAESRPCLEGVAAQNMGGVAEDIKTTQDDRPVTEKSSAEWYKVKEVLEDPRAQMAAMGFFLDGGLSITPLAHLNVAIEDAAACGTLDFALRLFTPKLDFNLWHLKERKTSAAACGRTYSENLLWDSNGKLVASMTQQCIMRPGPEAKALL